MGEKKSPTQHVTMFAISNLESFVHAYIIMFMLFIYYSVNLVQSRNFRWMKFEHQIIDVLVHVFLFFSFTLQENVLFCEGDTSEVEEHLEQVRLLRSDARDAADRADSYMIARFLAKNPPSSYNVGDAVFIKVVNPKSGVSRGGNPLNRPLAWKGVIVDERKDIFRYKVKYSDASNKTIVEWRSVNDITSITREEEFQRQSVARGQVKTQCACRPSCKRKPASHCVRNMNALCCRKNGKNCHFHKTTQNTFTKPSSKSNCLKYNLSEKNIVGKVMSDFYSDVKILKNRPNNQITLERNVRSAGLRVEETPKDGNCMFHALATQIRRTGLDISHSELRARIVQYLNVNRCSTNGSDLSDWVQGGNFDNYLSRMARDGEWGDEIILVAVSNMFNVEITIISSLPGTSIRILSPRGQSSESLPILLLGHLSELHYVSLIPENDTDPHVAKLHNRAKKLTRKQILKHVQLPNNDFNSDSPLPANIVRLGVNDHSRFWAAHPEQGSVETRNNHFLVSDEQMDNFDNFLCNQRKYERESRRSIVFIDIVFVFWLLVAGKETLLKKKNIVLGTFIYLNDYDAESYMAFYDTLIEEKEQLLRATLNKSKC